ILLAGATMRATVRCLFRFLLFVEEVLFVHTPILPFLRSSVLSFTQFPQIAKTVDPCLVAIAPAKIERVTSDDTYVGYRQLFRNGFRLQYALASPLVNT